MFTVCCIQIGWPLRFAFIRVYYLVLSRGVCYCLCAQAFLSAGDLVTSVQSNPAFRAFFKEMMMLQQVGAASCTVEYGAKLPLTHEQLQHPNIVQFVGFDRYFHVFVAAIPKSLE